MAAGTTVTWVNRDDVLHLIISMTGNFPNSKVLDTDQKHTRRSTRPASIHISAPFILDDSGQDHRRPGAPIAGTLYDAHATHSGERIRAEKIETGWRGKSSGARHSRAADRTAQRRFAARIPGDHCIRRLFAGHQGRGRTCRSRRSSAKHAGEELQHAIIIANQIDYLGGRPAVTTKPVKTSDKAVDMLRFDLQNEAATRGVVHTASACGSARRLGGVVAGWPATFARSSWTNRSI